METKSLTATSCYFAHKLVIRDGKQMVLRFPLYFTIHNLYFTIHNMVSFRAGCIESTFFDGERVTRQTYPVMKAPFRYMLVLYPTDNESVDYDKLLVCPRNDYAHLAYNRDSVGIELSAAPDFVPKNPYDGSRDAEKTPILFLRFALTDLVLYLMYRQDLIDCYYYIDIGEWEVIIYPSDGNESSFADSIFDISRFFFDGRTILEGGG